MISGRGKKHTTTSKSSITLYLLVFFRSRTALKKHRHWTQEGRAASFKGACEAFDTGGRKDPSAKHMSSTATYREIGDGVVKGLHLDQKTVLLERNASYVGSELGQDLGVGGVGKLAPVHLDGKFLEIVPSLEHSSPGGQASHQDAILADGPSNHARRHHQ